MHKARFPDPSGLLALVLLICVLALGTPAHADPAGRIGRLAWASGNIVLSNATTGESGDAPVNQPLTSGDILSTHGSSRAEIQIGSTTLRLDADSRLEFHRIDDDEIRLFLHDGRAIVKITSAETVPEFVLETRNGRFNARETGIYRLDTDSGSSTATVYFGRLFFESSDSEVDIEAGQSAQFWYSGQTQHRLTNAISDEFTQWSAARDQRPAANAYTRYVSPEMTGAQDLDAYGNWTQSAEHGAIWYPRAVPAGWAPYRTGHWAWVAPWGWTWIGNEPWGFAPFHYGRWIHRHGRWGWVPGARVARPVFAPALVAWIGTPGINLSLSIGRGPTVGWFPLAPREVYVPAYRSSEHYVRRVNVTHVTNIVNVTKIVSHPQAVIERTHYAHRDLAQAVTVVPADVVAHRRAVAPAQLSARDARTSRQHPLQVTAPVAAPRMAARPETDQQRERPGHPQSRPVPAPDAQAVSGNQRNRSPAFSPRPYPSGPDTPRRLDPVPPPTPASSLPVPQRETHSAQPRPERSLPPRDANHQPALATPQAETRTRTVTPDRPTPAPALEPQRRERLAPDNARPVTQTRPLPSEQRAGERDSPRQFRAEAATSAREPRQEIRREVARPNEIRTENHTQRHENRPQRNTPEGEKQKPRRDDAEKR